MPKFTIEHLSPVSPEETFQKVKKFLLEDQDLRKFDSQLKVEVQESIKQCQIESSKFKSQVNVQASEDRSESRSKVIILVDLPFLLTPFKNQISETLKLKLEKYLS